MRALQFITDHVIIKLRYNQIYQMKTTFDSSNNSFISMVIFCLNRRNSWKRKNLKIIYIVFGLMKFSCFAITQTKTNI